MIETMSFLDAISSFMSKYFCIKGRARRSEYWYFFLFAFLVYLTTQHLIPNLFTVRNTFFDVPITRAARHIQYAVNWSLFIMLIPPYFTVTVRRLHDCNYRSWMVLVLNILPLACLTTLNIVKMIGDEIMAQDVLTTDYMGQFLSLKSNCLYISTVCMIISIFLFTKSGTQGPNKYGPDPTLISQSENA